MSYELEIYDREGKPHGMFRFSNYFEMLTMANAMPFQQCFIVYEIPEKGKPAILFVHGYFEGLKGVIKDYARFNAYPTTI